MAYNGSFGRNVDNMSGMMECWNDGNPHYSIIPLFHHSSLSSLEPTMMYRIKICGITSSEDARLAVSAGADAIGLNFYEPSPRYVAPDRAREIAAAMRHGVTKVGVFVNASAKQVRDTFDHLRLDWIQLHGDEPPEFLTHLGKRPVVRAFRCRQSDLTPLADYLRTCRELGHAPQAVLLDAYEPGQYGGTGKVVDWDVVAATKDQLGELPVVLAGGINPTNVEQAILTAKPAAVDTASGVESNPGVKDPDKVQAFVAAARKAFDS